MGGVGEKPKLEVFWEESEEVMNELTDEVDIGLIRRSLFRIGEVCVRALPNPPLFYICHR